ncbi:hypothetical protein BHM03_00017193 [Ensete ventricosum]|nr:hypothetical protein BHM03_00017193 [Ensete ventricosum]
MQFTGWIEWDGERFEFENAPSYSEKNWGGGFPRKWFWVRLHFGMIIGVHYGGSFYEFVPWNGTISWDIAQWGFWRMSAENDTHVVTCLYPVELEATAGEPGTPLRAPTTEAGLVTACKDTLAHINQRYRKNVFNRSSICSQMILDVNSNMAALEVGGGPWFSGWKGLTSSPEVVSRALRVPIDVESFFPLPIFKPAGL